MTLVDPLVFFWTFGTPPDGSGCDVKVLCGPRCGVVSEPQERALPQALQGAPVSALEVGKASLTDVTRLPQH